MYEYVTNKEIREYRNYCAKILTELRDRLLDKDINTQFVLIGSGAKNMVMRNGNGPFDLDYNLNILNMPPSYRDNPQILKDLIRNELNYISRHTLISYGKDSTSVITTMLVHNGMQFKFDLAIIAENEKGHQCRLIHDKSVYPDRFYWNETPKAKNIMIKVDEIKKNGRWVEVRHKYAALKNMYLERQDYNHPSFICYIEAVNAIYQKCNKNKK